MRVLQKGFYFFDKKPFIVMASAEDMQMNTEVVKTLPFRVQFSKLDIKLGRKIA